MLDSVKKRCNKSQRLVLDMLCDAWPDGVSNGQFADNRALRFSSRKHELKPLLAEHGWKIEKELTGNKTWVYKLVKTHDNTGQHLMAFVGQEAGNDIG